MLNKTDIANAVSEGIITGEQAEQLNAFSKRVHANDDSPRFQELETRDEPFRLLRGFRDIFIALGILFLATGATVLIFAITGNALSFSNNGINTQRSVVEFMSGAVGAAILLIVGIVIAEIVTRKLRLPLSSLILSLAIALWAGLLGMQIMAPAASIFIDSNNQLTAVSIVLFFLSAFIGISLFYARYRLPFVMLVVAGTLVGLSLSIIKSILPDLETHDLRFVIGGLGFIVFLFAMKFDLKDRIRVTRLSENAFWLHLLAAPLMIHSILASGSWDQVNISLILTVFAILTLIALIIDRRAFLVSSLLYMGGAFTQIVRALGLDSSLQFAVPVLFIGVLVVVLGIGWSPLRRLIMTIVPSSIANRVPPIALAQISDLKEEQSA
ncbi:MAG: hypothetical protein ABJK39_13400 [Hyphomicrobiales bacterium]